MLFFLTGEIQIGKTRWLMAVAEELRRRGVKPCGVIAPGIWVPGENEGKFEKLGIDNLLLPEGKTIPFARRRDLARAEGAYDERSQSARADLQWAIDDSAIDKVNAHFANLALLESPGNRLLVVDELGRLELLCGEGLTNAVSLLERGATPALPHALVVVRAQLLETAQERFAAAPWKGMRAIGPSEESANLLLEVLAR